MLKLLKSLLSLWKLNSKSYKSSPTGSSGIKQQYYYYQESMPKDECKCDYCDGIGVTLSSSSNFSEVLMSQQHQEDIVWEKYITCPACKGKGKIKKSKGL